MLSFGMKDGLISFGIRKHRSKEMAEKTDIQSQAYRYPKWSVMLPNTVGPKEMPSQPKVVLTPTEMPVLVLSLISVIMTKTMLFQPQVETPKTITNKTNNV